MQKKRLEAPALEKRMEQLALGSDGKYSMAQRALLELLRGGGAAWAPRAGTVDSQWPAGADTARTGEEEVNDSLLPRGLGSQSQVAASGLNRDLPASVEGRAAEGGAYPAWRFGGSNGLGATISIGARQDSGL